MNLKVIGKAMIFCCDTSFLISLYNNDTHSVLANHYLQKQDSLISITPFNRFEFCHAFRCLEFRKLLSKGEAEPLITAFQQDLEKGFFLKPTCNLAVVFTEAHRLSSSYAIEKGYRAFDVLHVAAALHLEATHFLTFDEKQKKLAKSQGLKIPL